jgi:DDE domain
MAPISYRRHRFPPVVIRHAVWLYLRFTLSYRDVEELLAERGLDLSYESVRSWVLKFGPAIARGLRRGRPRPSDRWHLDEMVVRIAGKHMYVWRAVDHEGEVLEILVPASSQPVGGRQADAQFAPQTGLRADEGDDRQAGGLTALPSGISDFPATMSRACEKTIGRRIRIKWCVGASARCNASNQRRRRNAF